MVHLKIWLRSSLLHHLFVVLILGMLSLLHMNCNMWNVVLQLFRVWIQIICSAPEARFIMPVPNIPPLHRLLLSHLQYSFLSNSFYTICTCSYVCLHAFYSTYLSSPSLSLHRHIGQFYVCFEDCRADETTAVHKPKAKGAIWQHTINSAIIDVDPEYLPIYRSVDTKIRETMFSDVDRDLLIMKNVQLIKSSLQRRSLRCFTTTT